MESQKIVYSHYVLPKEAVIFENGDDIPEMSLSLNNFQLRFSRSVKILGKLSSIFKP